MEIKGNEREYFVGELRGGNFGRKLLDLLDYVNSFLSGAPQCRRNRATSPIAILGPATKKWDAFVDRPLDIVPRVLVLPGREQLGKFDGPYAYPGEKPDISRNYRQSSPEAVRNSPE